MTDTEIHVRAATPDEYDVARAAFTKALLVEAGPGQAGRRAFEPQRTLLAEIHGQVVGTAKALTRDMSVPGAVVPVGHVTGVGVSATHRRRGVLSNLMRHQLTELPEAVAMLWASDAGIYERFGYAPATVQASYRADLPRVKSHPPRDTGLLREITTEEAPALLDPVLRRYQLQRPGVSGRRRVDWEADMEDPSENRDGATALRILVHENSHGEVDGYAIWRGKVGFQSTGPASEVRLRELVAYDNVAYQALWHHLLTMDLATTLTYQHAAVDEPVRHVVTNHRALGATVEDGLWLRVVDVPRALSQRRYVGPVDLVLEVRDPLLPHNQGRFRLRADGDDVSCEPTTAAVDVSLSINALSAVYLGGHSLTELAIGGEVEAGSTSLDAASAAFAWPVAAKGIEII